LNLCLGRIVTDRKSQKIFEKTLIIIAAKHSQLPIDSAAPPILGRQHDPHLPGRKWNHGVLGTAVASAAFVLGGFV
jgi:hypothetical protein